MKRKIILLVVLFILSFGKMVFAEHPAVQGLLEFELMKEDIKENKDEKFTVREDGKLAFKSITGKYYYYRYEQKKELNEIIAPSLIINHYLKEAKDKNAFILKETKSELEFYIDSGSGIRTWCRIVSYSINRRETGYTIEILEEKGYSYVMKYSANQIKNELDREGKIILYAINFEENNKFKPEALEQLKELLEMMLKDRGMNIEIQGYTDDFGRDEENIKKSGNRAEQVKKFLELFSVENERIKSKGYGKINPVADNSNEEGRRLNRRIQIIKIKGDRR